MYILNEKTALIYLHCTRFSLEQAYTTKGFQQEPFTGILVWPGGAHNEEVNWKAVGVHNGHVFLTFIHAGDVVHLGNHTSIVCYCLLHPVLALPTSSTECLPSRVKHIVTPLAPFHSGIALLMR